MQQFDWSELAQEEQEHRWIALLKEDRKRGFNLAVAPLVRLTLVSLGQDEFKLLWTFHHILLDGRSFPLVLSEVFSFYEALRDGRGLEIPLPRSYREYIEWHREQNQIHAEEYWRRALKGFTTPTQLALPREPGAQISQPTNGAQEVRLPAPTTSMINAFAQDHGLTVNTLLQGAWAILLHRYTGDRDIVFGATRACRHSSFAGADSVVGLLINTLPMRVPVTPETRLIDWLHGLRAQQIALRAYEHTPLVKAQGWSEIPRGTNLFESIIVFENYLLDTRMKSLGGEWTNRHFEYIGQTNYPLTVVAYLDSVLQLRIEYDRRRFDDACVERMLAHLRTILEGMVCDPEQQLGELPILTKTEKGLLLSYGGQESANHTEEQCLQHLFERQAERNPDAIAVSCEENRLTYRELNRRANRLAGRLRALGVGPDVLVGLCVERSIEMVVGILAILKAGGAYVPLDPGYPRERLAFMLEDSAVRVLLTHEKLRADLPACSAAVLHFDIESKDFLTSDADDANLHSGVGPDNLAYVIYTSGSTGKPKGVLISHRNVVRLFHATDPWFHFDHHDVWTLFHSYAFDFSVWEIWGALSYGGRLVVVPHWMTRWPEAFARLLATEQVTVLNQTPSAFRQLMPDLIATTRPAELALRLVIFGGEALELQSLRPWFDHYGDRRPQLVNMYGITETTVHVTYRPLTCADLGAGVGSVIGKPIPDLRIFVLNEERQLVPIGVSGEMYVGGAGVARGYLGRPQLTDERFIADPFSHQADAKLYRTGDLARWHANGDLEYLGRVDHQVKIRGFRIELGEIEAVLSRHPAVRNSAVMAREDIPGDKRLVAYIATDEDIAVAELRDSLSAVLPDYMLPSAFVRLNALPLTANGKIDRNALPMPDHARPVMTERPAAPRGAIEETLVRIWGSVLGIESLGVHDNFFELGGDSILSIQIIVRARQAGLQLVPRDLFKHPTVAGLAAICAATRDTRPEQARVTGSNLLTSVQKWFFEQDLPDAHHWNQAFLFEIPTSLETAILQQALQRVAEHHDAFRLRFTRSPSGWQQNYADDAGNVSLRCIDLSKLSETEREVEMVSAATELQSSLDLAAGPIIRAGYFQLGSRRPARLLLVVHHLAIDGVSWRFLLEDLQAAYLALWEKKPVRLPPKTTSFQVWSAQLWQYARQSDVRAELEYWRGVASGPLESLPIDSSDGGDNSEASARTVARRLNAQETKALLQHVPSVHHTQINEVLLAALQRSLAGWIGSGSLLLDLEGHGREEIAEHLDVSRTIGWFTTIFPVKLELRLNESMEEGLRTIKTRLRRIPQRGLGYGALRYLSDDPGSSDALGALPQAQVSFNYLGQFDQVVSELSLFRFANEDCGPWHSPRAKRRYLIEVLALVQHGCFEVRWTYSPNLHRKETIEALADNFISALQTLIAAVDKDHARAFVPSDFPLAKLDQSQLDQLTAAYGDIEDLYPLSPMQQLFHSLEAAASPVGLEHWHYTLHGPLDTAALKRAWEQVLERHPVLRTAFISAGLREALQVVLRHVQLPWEEHDWLGLSAKEQERRLGILLESARQFRFQLSHPPLLRLALIRTATNVYRLLWTTHHLLIDGWSWPVIFQDLSLFYDAAGQGKAVQLARACPYGDYIRWLHETSQDGSETFWRQRLLGITAPTYLGLDRPQETAPCIAEEISRVSSATTAALQSVARQHHLTLNTFAQGAWALLLSRHSGLEDVCFGAAFAGRPAEMAGIESMVGPCVNDLPIRIRVRRDEALIPWLSRLQEEQFAAVQFQYSSPVDIHRWSQFPLRHRLFESLVVFQNYLLGGATHTLGSNIELGIVTMPETTNYPITLSITPGAEMRLKILYRQDRFHLNDIREVLRQLLTLLEAMSRAPARSISELLAGLPEIRGRAVVSPTAGAASAMARAGKSSTDVVPRSEMEHVVADLWRDLFQIEALSMDANFFDLGGHSLLLVRMHQRLQQTLNREFPIIALFQHSSPRALARYLTHESAESPGLREFEQRAARRQSALARLAKQNRKS
jgi:amino acid adenylation domain-containing protein/non-ribosomal peptide synthase protein (TIGR01720 family)